MDLLRLDGWLTERSGEMLVGVWERKGQNRGDGWFFMLGRARIQSLLRPSRRSIACWHLGAFSKTVLNF